MSEIQDHPDLTLQVHLSKTGWFWFAKVPGLLSHSSGERWESKEKARHEGLKVYPRARLKSSVLEFPI